MQAEIENDIKISVVTDILCILTEDVTYITVIIMQYEILNRN